MIKPCREYTQLRGSGLSRWGAIWIVALMVVVEPFLALALWAAPDKTDFGKFQGDDDAN